MKKSVIVTFEGDDADLESFLQWLTGHRLVMEIAECKHTNQPTTASLEVAASAATTKTGEK